ncbi:MAG: glycosyltransferase [Actinomycetota bacterium]
MTDSRPTVALYHHLPPGGAERAMYELTRRTADRYRYVLFHVAPSDRDPFAGIERTPIDEVVDEVRRTTAPVGGAGRLGRWTRAVPALLKAERRIASHIDALGAAATVAHHQRYLQAPALLHHVSSPSLYVCQEPRRRSFEYDLRHPVERSLPRRVAELPFAALDWWAGRHDIRTSRAADAIACNSDHSREYLWRAYGRDATVLRLGADADRFVLPEHDERDDEIVAVGALDPSKGHDLAIEAIGALPASDRPTLRIIHNRSAEGAEAELRRLADRHGVDVVFECGAPEETLVRRYQRARAVIATGRVEPLGLTPLEAMACGTPAVAVREGGYRETIVPGSTGELADRDAAALGDAIARVLQWGETSDRAEIRKRSAEVWNWDVAAATYAAMIDRLIA